MMADPSLEEAYIAVSLYKNTIKDDLRQANIGKGDTVKVRKINSEAFGNKQQGKQLKGTFTITETDLGPGQTKYKAKNERGEEIEIRANQIKKKMEKNPKREEELQRLKDVQIPNAFNGTNNAVHFREPNPRIQEEGNIMARSRTQKGGRETLALKSGITTDPNTQMVRRSQVPKETVITQEMISQPPRPPKALVLKPQLPKKTLKKVARVIKELPQEDQMVTRLKEKNYWLEQLGFAGNWNADQFWKDLNKEWDKAQENPKYVFGHPDIRTKHLSDKQKLEVAERLFKQPNETPYIEQYIPNEKDGTLVKRGRGRPRKH
jgi:hypothetical protein